MENFIFSTVLWTDTFWKELICLFYKLLLSFLTIVIVKVLITLPMYFFTTISSPHTILRMILILPEFGFINRSFHPFWTSAGSLALIHKQKLKCFSWCCYINSFDNLITFFQILQKGVKYVKTPDQRIWCYSGVILSLLWTYIYFIPLASFFTVDFEQVNVWTTS